MIDTGYRPSGVELDGRGGEVPADDRGLEVTWPDVELYAREDPPPKLKPGEYTARVVHVLVYDRFFKVAKTTATIDRLILTFRIVHGEHAGTEIPFYAPLPKSGGKIGGKRSSGRHVPSKSRFWRAWTTANGAPPKRDDRMSLNVFKNRLFAIQVRDVEADRHQNKFSESVKHSVVECVVERLA